MQTSNPQSSKGVTKALFRYTDTNRVKRLAFIRYDVNAFGRSSAVPLITTVA